MFFQPNSDFSNLHFHSNKDFWYKKIIRFKPSHFFIHECITIHYLYFKFKRNCWEKSPSNDFLEYMNHAITFLPHLNRLQEDYHSPIHQPSSRTLKLCEAWNGAISIHKQKEISLRSTWSLFPLRHPAAATTNHAILQRFHDDDEYFIDAL